MSADVGRLDVTSKRRHSFLHDGGDVPRVGPATLPGVEITKTWRTVGDLMNARFSVGSSAPSGAVCPALVAALLIPVLLAACDILGPSSSEEIILEPFEATWLSEPEPIDPVTHPPEPPPSGEVLVDSLFYQADLIVQDTALGTVPMSIRLSIRLRNPFDDPVTIEVPGCPERPLAYATIDRMDPPIWVGPGNSLGLAADCGTPVPGVSDITVPPQEQITGSHLLHESLLSRALPDGRYYFTMEFQRVDEDPILLPVGSADVRFQEPLLEFDVTLGDTGEQVRPAIQMTNRNDMPILLEWGWCSFQRLELYHDAARSNLAKRWWGLGCPDIGRVATLESGETIRPEELNQQAFDHAFILDLPPGTYFLSVRLEINQHDYHIPAGEIRLR